MSKDGKKELPEDYFCPVCNAKATHDFVEALHKTGMPNTYVVHMAINMLGEAQVPSELLKGIWEWSKKYGISQTELNEEEQEKEIKEILGKWHVDCECRSLEFIAHEEGE